LNAQYQRRRQNGLLSVDHTTRSYYSPVRCLFQTTLDILCGYQEMTSGEATVGGFDVKTQLDSVYKVLGVCPQFDCIWPDLTVQGM
jgi:hypothetical protein